MKIGIGISLLALVVSGLLGVGCKKDEKGTSMPPKTVEDLVSKESAPQDKAATEEKKADSEHADEKGGGEHKGPDTPTSSDGIAGEPKADEPVPVPPGGGNEGKIKPDEGGGVEPGNPGDDKGAFEEKGPPPHGGPGEPKGPPANRDRPDSPPPATDEGKGGTLVSNSGFVGEYEVALSAEQQKMIEGVQKMMKDRGTGAGGDPQMKEFAGQMMSMVKQFRLVILPKGVFQLRVPMGAPEKGSYSVKGNKLILKVDVAKADPKLSGMSMQNLTLNWDPGKKTLTGMAQGMLTTFRKVK